MKRLLTLAAMFLCCMATTFAQFSGSGSGTENDPYLILNPIQLNQIRNFLNQEGVYFKLMADIDLSEYIEDEYPSKGWLPIGGPGNAFKGILDGNHKIISGLWIDSNKTDYIGLFGYVKGAIIKDLSLHANVTGNKFVGAFWGDGGALITDCSVDGIIQGTTDVGGFSGRNQSGSFNNCRSSANVLATGERVGGMTGSGQSFSNCNCDNVLVKGLDSVGGFSGKMGSFTHCTFRGIVNGEFNVGGLVGYNQTINMIKESSVIGEVTGTADYVGGLAGRYVNNSNSVSVIIEDCFFSGCVSGNNHVGGVVGWINPYCYDKINRCCSYASAISGKNFVGGIAGTCEYGTISNCVAINQYVMAINENSWRIYGNGTCRVSNNKAYNKTVCCSKGIAQIIDDDDSNGTGVSANTLKLKATYVAMGYDFTDIWSIQETECYPYFKTQTAPPVITSQVVSGATTISGKCVDGGTITLEIDGVKQQMVSTGNTFSFMVSPLQASHEVRISAKSEGKEQSYYTTEMVSYLGKGTEDDPYQVYTASDLTGVYRKGYFKLMNDIDLTDYINQFSPTEGWESIGREGSETIYFDGNGHKITDLWCNSTRDNTGLFSCFANGTIKNLTIETAKGKQVKGGGNTGILIGKMLNGTIENCRVSGTVADGTPVGGLVGLFNGGKISLSQANVTINTTGEKSYVGGLVGEVTGGEIDQCVTQGTITGTGNESYVGGLVGKNSAIVTNCYSNAQITSSYNAAGLVAYNYGVVDKCYATGDLFSNNYAAGVIGYNDGEDAVVSNCAAMNNKIDVVYESQQTQQGGGYGQRIIGGIKNNAPAPELNNYALKTMQVSVNDVAQKVYDDIMNGAAKTDEELKAANTYQTLGWDVTDIWKINEGSSYPYLIGVEVVGSDEGSSGDLNGDGIINGVDLVAQTNLIMTNQYNAAADLNNDGVVNGLDYVIMVNRILSFTSAPAMQLPASNRAASTASLSIEDFYIKAGETKELFIDLNNTDTQVTLSQFDLRLPYGLSIAVEDGELVINIVGRTTWKKHSLMANTTDGITRFMLASNTNATIDGCDGNVISIKLTASDDFNGGNIKLENQLLVSPNAEGMQPVDFFYSLEGETTSINVNAIMAGHSVDIYTLTGSKVRSAATTLEGLPKGVYIIKGKKVIVK